MHDDSCIRSLCREFSLSCNRLPSVLFPRPGTSFGESVLLLFGERSATASDWGVECNTPCWKCAIQGLCARLLAAQLLSWVCLPLKLWKIPYSISFVSFIEKYFKKLCFLWFFFYFLGHFRGGFNLTFFYLTLTFWVIWVFPLKNMSMVIIWGIPWYPQGLSSNPVTVSRGARAYGMEGMQAQGPRDVAQQSSR